jgi:hypothetical protein
MFNPDTVAGSTFMPSFEAAARSLKVAPIIAPVRSDAEIETAIIPLGREPGGGLVVVADGFTGPHRASIISAAARNNVPAVKTIGIVRVSRWRATVTGAELIARRSHRLCSPPGQASRAAERG